MKAIRLFSMAAVALMMCACSEDVIEQKDAPVAQGMPFKATISMGGATRTTLTENSSSGLDVAWKDGDEVAICYGDGTTGYKDVFTVTPVGDGTATISGTLSGTATQGQAVTVYYPAAMVTSVDKDGNVNGTSAAPYASQAGTLAGIGSNCDQRQATTTFHVDGTGATLSSNVDLTGSTIIWKLNLEYASAALVADQVSFSILDPTSGKWTTAETVSGISKSEVYLAIPNYGYSDAKILIEATKGSDSYYAIYSGVTLAANTYYQSTLDMFKLGSGTLHILTSSTGDLTLNDGDVLTGTGGEDTHVTIAADANVILDNVDITSIPNDASHKWAGITCAGNAIVALVGTNKVKGGKYYPGNPGIQAGPSSTTLMIAGEGSLEATSSGSCAGIGSSLGGTCGNITILQGIITATSEYGAGIGSGNNGTCGNITISGGTVTATGESSGIGSGYRGTCGDINISDGTVTATYTGNLGSGIGSGDKGTCGAITISGGNITAAWVTNGLSHNGAGIGSGGVDDGSSTCGAITISGGTVKATGGTYAPGIGAGYAYSGTSTCGEITFSGGTVTAIAGTDAPTTIGKGYVSGTGTSSTGEIMLSTYCNVTMVNGNVTSSDPDTQNFLDTGDIMKSVYIGGYGYQIMSPKTVSEFDVPGALPSGFSAAYDGTNKSWHVWYL